MGKGQAYPRVAFLHNAPHIVHGAWAKSVKAKLIRDRVEKVSIRGVSRFLKSIHSFSKIPLNTDIVLCEGGSQLPTGVMWKIFWKILGKKKKLVLIASDPKLYYYHKMRGLQKKLNLRALKEVDLFIPTSPMMEKLIPNNVPGNRRTIIPFFNKEKLNNKEGNLKSRNLIFAARICKEKGADRLVNLFLKLREEFSDSKLFLLGANTNIQTFPSPTNLAEEIKKKDISNLYMTGLIPNPEDFMQHCSIYISLARIEPAGISVLEAMYMGLVPIVSFRDSDNKSEIEGTGNAHIVEKIDKELIVKNEEEAYKIIKKLWTNKKLREKYSIKSKQIASEFFMEHNLELSLKEFKESMNLIATRRSHEHLTTQGVYTSQGPSHTVYSN